MKWTTSQFHHYCVWYLERSISVIRTATCSNMPIYKCHSTASVNVAGFLFDRSLANFRQFVKFSPIIWWSSTKKLIAKLRREVFGFEISIHLTWYIQMDTWTLWHRNVVTSKIYNLIWLNAWWSSAFRFRVRKMASHRDRCALMGESSPISNDCRSYGYSRCRCNLCRQLVCEFYARTGTKVEPEKRMMVDVSLAMNKARR